MNSGDNHDYELRMRQARREGLFYVTVIIVAGCAGLALRWWP